MKPFFLIPAIMLFVACQYEQTYEPLISIKKDIEVLAHDSLSGREIGTAGEEKAYRYLVDRMKQIGLQPAGTNEYLQPFYVKKSTNPHEEAVISSDKDSTGTTGYNVIGFLDNPSDNIVIIGAHYDHLGFGGISSLAKGSTEIHNGADDNASGTAGLLHLAQLLSKEKLQSDVLFLAFSGEEQGLWGSNYFSNHPTIDLSKVNYMINMDMIGRLDTARGLAVYGTGTAPDWDETLDQTNTENIKLIRKESGKGPSDHTSFYLKDIPVLHFFTGQHEDYHKPSDDADKINIEGIIQTTAIIDRIIQQLDRQEKLTFQKTKDESTNAPRFTVSLGVMPDYLYDGKGMLVADVTADKPASKAGILKGDIVIQLGDSTITDMMSYMRALSTFNKGETTQVIVKRKSEELTLDIEF